MKLWCSVCHTFWPDVYADQKCLFKDCAGRLTTNPPPQIRTAPREPKGEPTYPLLELTGE